mmetsp:Transcript_44591/g.129031  ORF Transcript_44591/g.129031 Transcript_44591/m.129031 type:complete len:240 (-) Transcript_44591:2839-3558(-)
MRSCLWREPRELPLCIGDHLDLVQQLVPHEVQQVLPAHPPVPVVHDVPSVHDLAEDVAQVVPRDLHRRRPLQVVVQHLSRVAQIAGRERILHVVPHGPELLPLQHQRVEVHEREEDGLDLRILVLEVLLAEECKGPPEVCQHALGGLVRQLYGALENADGDAGRRIRGEDDPEAWVAVLHGEGIQLLLELDTPPGHQVDVLQHDPVALSMADVQLRHCHNILTLAHRHVVVVGVELEVD